MSVKKMDIQLIFIYKNKFFWDNYLSYLSAVSETYICNFADDNTLYACDISMDKVLQRLKTKT